MRFLIFLLFSAAAISVVRALDTQTEFMPKFLEPDLKALMKYYENGDKSLIAYIHWPHSVTFVVMWIEDTPNNEAYLKINAVLKKKSFGSHRKMEGLFYKFDGKFYYRQDKRMVNLPSDKSIIYTAPPVTVSRKSYLSIRYFSLEEIRNKASNLYNANKKHFETVLRKYPATFMITPEGSDGLMLEYTYSCENNNPTKPELAVNVLIGTAKKNKVRITDYKKASQLVYDQQNTVFTIPEAYFLNSKPLKDVFGVRMLETVFLAEKHDSQRRLFNYNDLILLNPHTRDVPYISNRDLLDKAKEVEPRMHYNKYVMYRPQTWPTSIQFQVKGVVFRKSANVFNGKIFDKCPFSIKHVAKKSFSFENNLVERLCTDDLKLWIPLSNDME